MNMNLNVRNNCNGIDEGIGRQSRKMLSASEHSGQKVTGLGSDQYTWPKTIQFLKTFLEQFCTFVVWQKKPEKNIL